MHLDRDDVPDLALATAEIPHDIGIRTHDVAALPPDWKAHPQPRSKGEVGDWWWASTETAVLCVPAVISPEMNHLLNLQHPSFSAIRLGEPEPLTMDSRLFGPWAEEPPPECTP